LKQGAEIMHSIFWRGLRLKQYQHRYRQQRCFGSVEYLTEPGFLLALTLTVAWVVVRISEVGPARWLLVRLLGRRCHRSASFNELVQLTTVQPYSAALWAVVDLNALTIAHHQGRVIAMRAFHMVFFQFNCSFLAPNPNRF
jgi:hypothetical protein